MPIFDILQQLADDPSPAEPHIEFETQPEATPAELSVAEEPVPMPTLSHDTVGMHAFLSTLFSARDKAHQLHLRTKSFSKHIALNELYDGLLEKADELVEVTQGVYGVLKPISMNADSMLCMADSVDEEIRLFIDALNAAIIVGRGAYPASDTFILNIIDEVAALVYRAKYKLDNLA